MSREKYLSLSSLSEANDLHGRLEEGMQGPMRTPRAEIAVSTLADLGARNVHLVDAEYPQVWFETDVSDKGIGAIHSMNCDEVFGAMTTAPAGEGK